jgi:hypothetical protein
VQDALAVAQADADGAARLFPGDVGIGTPLVLEDVLVSPKNAVAVSMIVS